MLVPQKWSSHGTMLRLDCLPPHILIAIASYLCIPDLSQLSQTNRATCRLIQTSDEQVWKPRCLALGLGPSKRRQGKTWYKTFRHACERLAPYIAILKDTGGHSTSPSQIIALLFPTSRTAAPTTTTTTGTSLSHGAASSVGVSLSLMDQAEILSHLVLLLTPWFEPTSEWAFLKRILVGGGGVMDRWAGTCLTRFEALEQRAQAASSDSQAHDKIVHEMRRVARASWIAHEAVLRSNALSAPPTRTRPGRQGNALTAGLARSSNISGLGRTDDDSQWELGRVWVEKREVFYESTGSGGGGGVGTGGGGKFDSSENIVKLPAPKRGQPATHTLDFTPMSAVFMERMLSKIRSDCSQALEIFGAGAGSGADGETTVDPGQKDEDEAVGPGIIVVGKYVERLVGEVVSLIPDSTTPPF